MNREQRIGRGRSARHLLEQDVFRESMDMCLRLVQERWANTKPDDPTSREVLFHQFTAIHQIEDMLKNFLEDGTRAEEENGDE